MPKGFNSNTGRGVRFKDRTASRRGRLVFTRVVGENAHRHKIWEAQCDCGEVTTTSSPHKTQSCGCLQREMMAAIQSAKALPRDVKVEHLRASAAKQRARRKQDPLAVMQARLSRLHRHALAQVNAIKASPTFEQLGYTVGAFVQHIERQFMPGMGWHNMHAWQIDHIVPVSGAKDESDVVALNQLPNLRPMWAPENNAKNNKRTNLL